jgi:hypothetical protein
MAILFKISNEGLPQFLRTILHTVFSFEVSFDPDRLPLTIDHSQYRFDGVFAEATLAQESRNPAQHPGRGELPGRRNHLHGQVPFTHLAVASP